MKVIKNFMANEDMTIDDLIEQLSEIRKVRGNLPVVIPVEFEVNGESAYALGMPRRVTFSKQTEAAEIELKNYFEV